MLLNLYAEADRTTAEITQVPLTSTYAVVRVKRNEIVNPWHIALNLKVAIGIRLSCSQYNVAHLTKAASSLRPNQLNSVIWYGFSAVSKN